MFLAPDPISFAIALVVMVTLALVGLSRASKVNNLLLAVALTVITAANWYILATRFDTHGLTILQYVAQSLWWVAVLGFISGSSIGLWCGLGSRRTAAATVRRTA